MMRAVCDFQTSLVSGIAGCGSYPAEEAFSISNVQHDG